MSGKRLNCWEFKKCGREPGGANSKDGNACIASVEARTDGVNSGKNGGRTCWAIAGTECGGKPQGTFAQKIESCQACEFYLKVMDEEYPQCEYKEYTADAALISDQRRPLGEYDWQRRRT